MGGLFIIGAVGRLLGGVWCLGGVGRRGCFIRVGLGFIGINGVGFVCLVLQLRFGMLVDLFLLDFIVCNRDNFLSLFVNGVREIKNNIFKFIYCLLFNIYI